MKISIIMPVYNCEKYVGKCIESVQVQSYKDWELIIIDDQSSDSSYDICKKYAESDSRIYVERQKNAGSGPARNKGIALANGKYVMFCDADDYLLPDSLRLLTEEIIRSNVDLVIGGYREFKYIDNRVLFCSQNNPSAESVEGIKNVRHRYIEFFDKGLIQAPWAKLYKLEIIRENMINFAEYRRCQDTVFNLYYYDKITSVAVISDLIYAYQTPAGDTYIRKFPQDMINIRLDIDELLVSTLTKWECYNQNAKLVFNKILMTDILVCCRLNFMNNWTNNDSEHRLYIKNLISNDRVLEVISMNDYGIVRNTLCKVLKTGNYMLIKWVNLLLIRYLYKKNKF